MGWEKRMRESWAGSVGVCGWGGAWVRIRCLFLLAMFTRVLEDSSKTPRMLLCTRRFVSELLRSFTSTRRSKGTITSTEDM